MTEDTQPKPYVNDYQKRVAESGAAGVCLVLWEIGAASTVVAGLLRTNLLLIVGGVVWLLVSLFIHF